MRRGFILPDGSRRELVLPDAPPEADTDEHGKESKKSEQEHTDAPVAGIGIAMALSVSVNQVPNDQWDQDEYNSQSFSTAWNTGYLYRQHSLVSERSDKWVWELAIAVIDPVCLLGDSAWLTFECS